MITSKFTAVRTQIERDCQCSLAWTIPLSKKQRVWHFPVLSISDYLIKTSPSSSIGAINRYVWQMAFAEEQYVFENALNNLIGLLPADFGVC